MSGGGVKNAVLAVLLVSLLCLFPLLYGRGWLEYTNVPFTFVLVSLISMCAAFIYASLPDRDVKRYSTVTDRYAAPAAAFFCIFYGAYFAGLALLRHNLFLSNALDLGWENQAAYNLAMTGVPYSTFEPSGNDFSDHAAFIYYLLAPFYRIFPGPEFLLVTQALAVAVSGFILYLFVKESSGSPSAGLVLMAAYLIHPSVQGSILNDFHPLMLSAPFIMLCFLAAFKKNTPLLAASYLLLLIVREDAAITALFIMAFFMMRGMVAKKTGIILLSFGFLYTLAALYIMHVLGKTNEDIARYPGLFPEVAGLLGLIFSDPVKFLAAEYKPVKLETLLIMLGPALFLTMNRASGLFLLIPGFFFTLLSNWPPQYTAGYYYGILLACCLFGLAALQGSFTKSRGMLAYVLIFSILNGYLYGNILSKSYRLTWTGPNPMAPTENLFYYNGWIGCYKKLPWSVDHESLALLRQIPRDLSATSDYYIVPHLSSRRYVYLMSEHKDTDVYVLRNIPELEKYKWFAMIARDYYEYARTGTLRFFIKKGMTAPGKKPG